MPTPAGHTLTALAAWTAARPWSRQMIRSPLFWLAVISASAPDLDLIPGLFFGDEALFHRGAGHSITAAVLYGLTILATVFSLTRSWRRSLEAALFGAGLFTVHLLLDLVGQDPGPPYGIRIFWPFTDRYFLSAWNLFPHLDRHPFDWSVPLRAIPVAAAETVVLGPFVAVAALFRRRAKPSS